MDDRSESMSERQNLDVLLRDYLRGSEGAFERFYKESYNDFYLYALHFESDEESVRELLQRFYLDIFEHPEKYASSQNARAYLLRSLKNLFLQERRKAGVRMKIHQKSVADSGAMPSPETGLIDQEEDLANVQTVKMIMDHMSRREREIVYLRYFQGLSSQEVGAVLAITPQVVRNLTYRAIQKIRGKYKGRKEVMERLYKIKAILLLLLG